MSDCCGSCCQTQAKTARYRRILWVALGINFAMFVVEVWSGFRSNSASLLADSLDFLGDAGNYGISLFVLSMALHIRAKASLIKGYTMGAFGIWVLISTAYLLFQGKMPNYHDMSVIGAIALIANVLCAVLLYTFREGDSNMRGVWICSRNDAIGNLFVIFSGVMVYVTQSNLPDLIVAAILSYLGISGARTIIRHARQELTQLNASESDPSTQT